MPLFSVLWVFFLLVWVSLSLELLCFSVCREYGSSLHWVGENHSPSKREAGQVMELYLLFVGLWTNLLVFNCTWPSPCRGARCPQFLRWPGALSVDRLPSSRFLLLRAVRAHLSPLSYVSSNSSISPLLKACWPTLCRSFPPCSYLSL